MQVDCPLFKQAQLFPKDLFIDGLEKMSYLQFEAYVQQLSKYLQPYQEKDVIAVSCQHPSFFIAMLIAAMRKKIIVFALHSRLTSQQKKEFLSEAQAIDFFEEPIAYDKETRANLKASHVYLDTQPLTYLLTSGSTAKPKICVHSLSQHLLSAEACNKHLCYQKGHRWLMNMPLYHVSGLSIVFRTLMAGATLVLPIKDFNQAPSSFSVTHLSCVNTQLLRLIDKPSGLNQLNAILLGGSPPLAHLTEKAKKLCLPLYFTYGLTEMSSQVATSIKPFGPLQKLSHVELSLDHQNQLLVRGSSLFLGYLKNNQIIPSINREGWFETKDLGEITNGEILIKGRIDNLFICGGENIQPEEIEEKLLKYPGVLEAIVVPKPHPEFDYEPVGFLRVTDTFDAACLKSFLQQTLPSFKIPKKFLPLKYSSLKPCRKTLAHSLSTSLNNASIL